MRDLLDVEADYIQDWEFYPKCEDYNPEAARILKHSKVTIDTDEGPALADFSSVFMLPCCSAAIFKGKLTGLSDWVIKYDFLVEGDPLVAFRARHYFDLVDLERSSYSRCEDRGPYFFKSIVLHTPPPEDCLLFSCDPPPMLRYKMVVSDKFVQMVMDQGLTGLEFKEVTLSA